MSVRDRNVKYAQTGVWVCQLIRDQKIRDGEVDPVMSTVDEYLCYWLISNTFIYKIRKSGIACLLQLPVKNPMKLIYYYITLGIKLS